MEIQYTFKERYEQKEKIGQGSFGSVYKVQPIHENVSQEFFCAKILRINYEDQEELTKIEDEIEILKKLQHQNITKFIELFKEKQKMIIVMELAVYGSLFDLIEQRQQSNHYFQEDEIMNLIIQLIQGINHMHEKKILHRDIKPENIFLGTEGKIKIGDFGISRMFDQTKQYTMSMIGTPYYVSPELVNGEKYSYKSDVWAIGCILYELCYLKRAFDGKSPNYILNDIVDLDQYPDINNFRYSNDLLKLIQDMLDKDQNTRRSIKDIFKNQFFKDHLQRYEEEQNNAELVQKYAQSFILDQMIAKKLNLDMDQSEISESNQVFITDIARLSSYEQDVPDLEFSSDESEKIFEKVKLVQSQQGTVNILGNKLFQNSENNYNSMTLQDSIFNVYKHQYQNQKAEEMMKLIHQKMIDGRIQEFINLHTDGEAMAMALIFFNGVQDENTVKREASFILRQKISDSQVLKNSHVEINYWINRALVNLKKYAGECTRVIQIDDPKLIAYYEPGKIFSWSQFSSANEGALVSEWTKDRNVIFHIYGQTCRDVQDFTSEKNQNEKKVVVFGLKTEFLVCKKQFQKDSKWHIYIREIKTGIGQNIIMWVDDDIFPNSYDFNYKTYNLVQQQAFDKNLHFILKSSTDTAMAYVRSPLFKASLQVCNYFKLISDVHRRNETNGRPNEYAGPNFIKEFLQETKNFVGVEKVKTMIYCGNEQVALEKFKQVGLKDNEIPIITADEKAFIQFVIQ